MQLAGPIISEKLLLRSLSPDDASDLYLSWLSDCEINRYLEVRFSPPRTVAHLANFITEANASSQTLLLGIFLKRNGRHIGNIKLGPIDWNHATGDVGFLIGDRQEWGKGYASTAIDLLSQYAFNQLSLAKLTAGCYEVNEGSRRALMKAGFIEEGRRVSQCLVGYTRQDGILLGKVNPTKFGRFIKEGARGSRSAKMDGLLNPEL